MTERLYYHNAYQTVFQARVVEHTRVGQRLGVVLDKTLFYPTSGGQPCDHGTINYIPVVDVQVRDDNSILHVLADEIWNDEVDCQVDWPRRFDHMQQHTGQHILSAVFDKLVEAPTVGFHMSDQFSTIDLDVPSLTQQQIDDVEAFANQIVTSDRPVTTTIYTHKEALKLPLRKPPQVEGPIRVIEVDKLDHSACGGTHVRRTGEVGPIKITKLETRGQTVRVEFRCGGRALADYQAKHQIVTRLAGDLTVGYWDLDAAVARLRDEVKTLRSEQRQTSAKLLEYEAQFLMHHALFENNLAVVSHVFTDRDRQELGWLAKTLTSKPGVVVLFGLAGPKSHILCARSSDVDRDMVLLLKTALRVLGSTAGGGRPELAQGGGPAADEKRIEQAIDRARRLLLAQRS